MYQTIRPARELRVSDLVLDPYTYYDVLVPSVRQGRLDGATVEHLAEVLPVAITQLDAVGDMYGALALVGLYDQLVRPDTVV